MSNLDKKIKLELKNVFNYPKPKHKKEFINTIDCKAINKLDLYFIQASYIRKRAWLISLAFFILLLFLLSHAESADIYSSIWVISSFVPFISLIMILEITRSSTYKMDEIEMSCKYNCSDIIFIRSSLLGIFNLIILCLATILLAKKLNYNTYILGLYLLTPFILTNIGSSIASSYIKGYSATYICLCISCIISIAYYIFTTEYSIYFTKAIFIIIWSIFFILLFSISIIQLIFSVKNKENFYGA